MSKKVFMGLMVVVLSLASFTDLFSHQAEAATSFTQVIQFDESTSQTRSKTITLPHLGKILSVLVDNGNVNYSKSGYDLTVTVSNGDWLSRDPYFDPQKYSKYMTEQSTSTSTHFSYSKSYSDSDGYSGTLTKKGSPVVISGNYKPSDSQTVSTFESGSSNYLPASLSYNSGGYSGILQGQGVTRNSVADGGYWQNTGYWESTGHYETKYRTESYQSWDLVWCYDGMSSHAPPCQYASHGIYSWVTHVRQVPYQVWVYEGQVFVKTGEKWVTTYKTIYNQTYSGTVIKPAVDTRVWQQAYSGNVYLGGMSYRNYTYAYTVTVTYQHNNEMSAEILHTQEWANKLVISQSDQNFLAGEGFVIKAQTTDTAKKVTVIPPDVIAESQKLQPSADQISWETTITPESPRNIEKGSYTFTVRATFEDGQVIEKPITITIGGKVITNIHLTQ